MEPTEPQLPQIWNPAPFAPPGSPCSDLLPTLHVEPDREEIVGRENVDGEDLILPTLQLLQGMSPQVMKGTIDGARAGMFYHSGAQEVFDAPVRLLVVKHHKSNAFFPDPKNPAHFENGVMMKRCVSRDAVTGSEYGECETCRKCLDWGEDRTPPIGSQAHVFTCLTSAGPAIIRFARTSYRAARDFISRWMGTSKNLWAHPTIISVIQHSRELPGGRKAVYYSMSPSWQQKERTPPELVAMAQALAKQVETAHKSGHLGGDDESEENDKSTIPF